MSFHARSPLQQFARDMDKWTPEWEAVPIFPVRYRCTEDEYLALDYNKLLEYADGFLEVLPAPTIFHQLTLGFLARALDEWVRARQLGVVLFAPFCVRMHKGKFRQPDLLFMEMERARLSRNDYWERPDLVMEVVSERNRLHHLVTKRGEYAQAGIPEYWIVDPEEERITVFILKASGETYVEHGTFRKGERAESKLLPGFGVEVTTTLSQRPGNPR